MARTSMAALIAAVRLLTDDPADPSATPPVVPLFTDDQYQDALDRTRADVRYLELAAAASIASGGHLTWLDFYAMTGSVGQGDWEDDVLIQGNTFQTLTPATSDPIVGHWTFSTDTRPPVYLTGKHYDRFAAAAEILRDWAAKLKLKFSFATDGQRFNLSEQREALIDLAERYEAKARPTSIQMVRSDAPHELWTRRNFDVSRTTF